MAAKHEQNQKRHARCLMTNTHECAMCSKRLSGGFAYFSFGACVDLLLPEDKELDDTIMEGFCNIGYHGADPCMHDSVDYCVADDIEGGQLDIQFCSLDCLRNWFCGIVDELERKLSEKRED